MNKIRNIVMWLSLLLVTVFIAGSAFYCLYWVERPAYAITMVCNAVREKNPTNFEKYVDLRSIYGSAYDDYTDLLLDKNSNLAKEVKIKNKMAKALAHATFQNVKPDVVNMLSQMTLDSIAERNSAEDKDSKKDIHSYGIKNIFRQFFDTLCEENNLKGLQAEHISLEEVRSGVTAGKVEFSNKKGGEPLIVKFEMTKVTGDNWKISKITNIQEIVARVNRPVTIESLF